MPPVFFDGLLCFVALFFLILGFIFAFFNQQKGGIVPLGWAFIILGFAVFCRFLEASQLILSVPHLIEIDFPFCFLAPPLYLFYVTAYLWNAKPTNKTRLLHFIPAIAAFLFLLPVFMMNTDEKKQYILTESSSSWSWRYQVLNTTFFISSVSYFVYILMLTRKHNKVVAQADKTKVKWIRVFTLGYLLIQLAALLFMFTEGQKKFNYYPILLVLVLLILIVWALQASNFLNPVAINNPEKEEKYKHSALSEETVRSKADVILNTVMSKQLFLNKNLSLKELSTELELSPHLISEVINRQFGSSLNDFINGFRIEYSKTLLVEKHKTLKIESIADESGFNSKAAFYANFKKMTGVSPLEFLKKQAVP